MKFVAAVLAVLFVASALAQADAETCPVYRAAAPVTIDGALDEPCWKTATAYRVDYEHGRLGSLCTQALMTVKYAWDDHYLYIGYETFDTNLQAETTGELEGPPGNRRRGCVIWTGKGPDCVEFFLSWGSERYVWELHHNAENDFNDIWCVVHPDNDPATRFAGWDYGIRFCYREYLPDDGPDTVAMATKLKPKAEGGRSTINDPSDVDTGYTAELRLPWFATGIAMDRAVMGPPRGPHKRVERVPGLWKVEGLELWVLAVVQDADSHARYHHSGPAFKAGWFHRGAANWPRLVFQTQPEKALGSKTGEGDVQDP